MGSSSSKTPTATTKTTSSAPTTTTLSRVWTYVKKVTSTDGFIKSNSLTAVVGERVNEKIEYYEKYPFKGKSEKIAIKNISKEYVINITKTCYEKTFGSIVGTAAKVTLDAFYNRVVQGDLIYEKNEVEGVTRYVVIMAQYNNDLHQTYNIMACTFESSIEMSLSELLSILAIRGVVGYIEINNKKEFGFLTDC